MTIDEIVKATGLTKAEVHSAVHALIAYDRVESFPVSYSLTPKGEAGRDGRSTRERAKRISRKVAPAEVPAPEQVLPKAVKPSAASEREVRSALINRHPLDSFFGARA